MKKPRNGKSRKNATPATGSLNYSEMNTTEIRDLIDFISKSGLNEVDIETKQLKLHVKRKPDQKVLKTAPAPMVAPIMAPAPQTVPSPAAPPPAKVEKVATNNIAEIKSPMIGTFYRSTNPDSPPFVSVGDKVSQGQTVCIIEAMKLFNEIESEVSGTVVKVVVENSTPVEYDQVLFLVEPD